MLSNFPCVYCDGRVDPSSDTVHIVPESLGNLDHILISPAVCKECNNYIGFKVEKRFMESDFVTSHRFHLGIPSKGKGTVPLVTGLLTSNAGGIAVQLGGKPKDLRIVSLREEESDAFKRLLAQSNAGMIALPGAGPPPKGLLTSRFVAKMAVEATLSSVSYESEAFLYWFNALQSLARHARRGDPSRWATLIRQAYPADTLFSDKGEVSDILHEFDFASDGSGGLFFFLRIFGAEFAIDLGWDKSERIEEFLASYRNASPMVIDRIAEHGSFPTVAPNEWSLWS